MSEETPTTETTEATTTESTSTETKWHEGVDFGEYTPSERVTQFGSISELAKGYDEAFNKIQGKGILLPGEKATEEERAKFESTLKEHLGITVPESADKYSWKLPDDMANYADVLTEQLKSMHESGVDDKTASVIMDESAKAIKQITSAIQENQAEMAKATEQALKDKWGESNYESRMKAVNKLQERFPDVVEQLTNAGMANSQPVIEMMDEVARSVHEGRPLGDSGAHKSIEQELSEIKQSDAYRNGRHQDHQATIAKVMELQKRRATAM